MRLLWIGLMSAVLATAETDARALEWLHKAQEKAGGVEKLEAVRDVKLVRHMRNAAAGMNAEQTLLYMPPGAMRQESALPFGVMTVYVDGAGGWMKGPQGLMNLPAPQLKQAKGELFRLREALLLADRLGDRAVRFLRAAEDEGRKAAVLQVEAKQGGESAEVWIDQDSGDFYKVAYLGVVLAGQPPRVEERYSDFRVVNGLRIPHKTAIYQNGALLTDVATVEAVVNSGLKKDDLAARPQNK
jgi:hypothetical protein